jgi:uncharacterized protein (TIGR02453 family)
MAATKKEAANKGSSKAQGFAGWPKPGLQFLKGVRTDNSKTYFEAHRREYESALKEPTEALFAQLGRDFGTGWHTKIFRINRDLRFTKDKRPYNDHVSGIVRSDRSAGGFYLQFSPDGLYVAVGCYEMAADQLKRYRDAVSSQQGDKLARIVSTLEKDGYSISEPRLKKVPAGYAADHPRADLLRRTGLMVNRNERPGPWMHTGEALNRIRAVLRDTKPLSAWLDANVGASTLAMSGR